MVNMKHCGDLWNAHVRHGHSELAEFGKRHKVIDYVCKGTTQAQADEWNTPEEDEIPEHEQTPGHVMTERQLDAFAQYVYEEASAQTGIQLVMNMTAKADLVAVLDRALNRVNGALL